MKNNLERIGAKTGLGKKDIKTLTAFGFLGLLGAALVTLLACSHNKKMAEPATPENVRKEIRQETATQAGDPDSRSTPPVKQSDSASPWEGYPAGTRYATVSHKDFKGE
ncbi:MAG: hypothetical protein WCS77_09840 [Elusimicrobiaceae bacterium]